MGEVPADEAVFAVVGMSVYDHHEDLEFVARAVPKLRDALMACGFRHRLPELLHGGSHRQVTTLLPPADPWRDRSVVLYWAGHGAQEGARHYLLVQDSPPKDFEHFNAVSAASLASILVKWRFRHALVVVDACYAGASSTELIRGLEDALDQQPAELRGAVEIIASCGSSDRAQDGLFAERFVRVLTEGGTGRDWDPGNELVYCGEVLEAIKELDELAPAPVYRAYGSPRRMFPNPRAIPGLPPADAPTQRDRQRRILDIGLRDHFRQAARSIEVDETGWYFTGRTRLLRELLAWLGGGEAGLGVVTGSPGTGKSAVLGRIATLSDPAYRRLAAEEGAMDGAEPGTVPVEGLIDVALHAKNKSLAECRELLAAGLSLAGGWKSSRDLVQAVESLGRPLRIIVDALDEARPDAVAALATDLLLPLARVPHLRLLVGTRTHAPFGGASLIRLLDPVPERRWILDEDLDTEQDLHAYVTRRLGGSPAYGDDVEAVATAVTLASGNVFLFARIATQVLARMDQPLRLGTEAAGRLLSGAVRDVFAADLARHGDQEQRVRDLLAPLAWAEGAGLPRYPVWAAMATAMAGNGARYGVADVDWLLDHAGHHVSQSSEDGQAVFRLYHQAFADYFRESHGNQVQIQRAITQALRDTLPEDPALRDWADADPYLLRHLSAHAAAAGRLGGLTREPGYLAHADPLRLLEVLGNVNPGSYPQTRVFWRAAHRLQDPAQRAAVLFLTALEHEPGLVPDIFPPPAGTPLVPRWSKVDSTPFHRTLTGHDAPVTAVAIGRLPGGDAIIVSGDRDGVVRVWDAATGTSRVTLAAHDRRVTALAVGTLDDGTSVIATGDLTRTRLWEAGSGLPLGSTTFTAPVRRLTISGMNVISVGVDVSQVWNTADGTVLREPWTNGTFYTRTADGPFSTDGTVYSIPADADVTGALLRTLPDGTDIVVASSKDGKVRVWDVETKVLRATLTGHDYGVLAIAAGESPYGGLAIVSGGDDRTVRIWDASLRTEETTRHHPVVVAAGTGVIASGGSDGSVRLWDQATGDLRAVLTGHEGRVWGVALDGTTVAGGGKDGHVRLWDLNTGELRMDLTVCEGRVWGVTLGTLADGTAIVAAACADGMIRVWDATTGAPRHTLAGHRDEVNEVAYADGVLVSASRDGTVRVWDATTGAPRHTLDGHGGWVEAVTARTGADGTMLIASAGRDCAAVVWDAMTGARRTTLTEHGGAVWGVALGELGDGTPVVVTGGADNTLRLWDLEGRLITRLPMPCVITSVAAEGSLLAVTTSTGVSAFTLT
ncbi:hypothetical protein [Nonomuraea rubra]|uniref:hypothetical protein n=1 Tax=Nonomuraea rubra TaxID=46180 RepID=UPI0033FC8311